MTAMDPILLPSDHPEIAAVLPLSLSTFFAAYFNRKMMRLNHTDTAFDPAAKLWSRRDLLPTFEAAMHTLVSTLGEESANVELVLAPSLKDPVRVHEKAMDDYVHDFDDWDDDVVIPEACVLDMLRGRGVCKTGSTMRQL